MMENIQLNIEKALSFVSKETINAYASKTAEANKKLHAGSGKGSDFLGWINLPSSLTSEILEDIC